MGLLIILTIGLAIVNVAAGSAVIPWLIVVAPLFLVALLAFLGIIFSIIAASAARKTVGRSFRR